MLMKPQNGFNDLIINIGINSKAYSIKHLENLSITVRDLVLHDNQKIDLSVHMRPTNHLYSIKFEKDKHDEPSLESSGKLLRRYDHSEGNYQLIGKPPVISTERRVFCESRYRQSYLFPLFVEFLRKNYTIKCVLANNGDDRTCLSMLFPLPVNDGYDEDDRYLVFFKLHKINGNSINMLIETGFVVKNEDFRAKKIEDKNQRSKQKPFIVILKNTLSGRRPFDSPPKPKVKKQKVNVASNKTKRPK